MIHRRGLSPKELEDLDPELFELLKIYDQNIEPNGSTFQTAMFANLCHLMLVSSGNLSERGQKEASVLDWDMFGLLRGMTSGELLESHEIKKNKEAQANMNSIIDMIKDAAEKGNNKNGKK